MVRGTKCTHAVVVATEGAGASVSATDGVGSGARASGDVVDGRANEDNVCFITTHGQRLLELRIRINLTCIRETAWVHVMLC